MRGGEDSFNRILLVVAQDIKKQMLLNDSSEFVYQLSLDGLTKDDITHDEHVKAVKLLKKRGLIEASQLVDDEGPGSRSNPYTYDTPTLKLSVQVNTGSLDKLINELEATIDKVADSEKIYTCELRLNETQLYLVIDGDEVLIASLQYDRGPYKVLSVIQSSPGTIKRSIDIFPSLPSSTNVRQILGKSNYKCLELFIESPATNMIALRKEVMLSKTDLIELLPKINENYRKNLEVALKTL